MDLLDRLTGWKWKLTAVLAAVALAGLAWGGWRVHSYLKDVEATRTALRAAQEDIAKYENAEKLRVTVRKVETDVAKKHGKIVADITAKEDKRADDLVKSLDQEEEWANVRIPQAVLDTLRD